MTHKKHRLSRRDFLKRTATVSLGTLAAGALSPAALQAQAAAPIPPHGSELRGMSLVVKNPTAEGRFGFMIKSMPPYVLNADPELPDPMRVLGQAMLETLAESNDPLVHDENDRFNENPNPEMTAGVTFLGQFIDHDITFDSTKLSDQLADPDAVTSFRTPRYDLDALYGLGPSDPDHQKFYDPNDRNKFLIVTNRFGVEDLPRQPDDGTGIEQAIIADPRNDQTMIIAQLHLAFMRFHNRLVDYCRSTLRVPSSSVFESARRLARWYYQWMVIHDFLPRIVGKTMAESVYKDVKGKAPIITMKYYKPQNKNDRAFIPVEFSVAAYRFGHSIARPRYTLSGSSTTAIKGVPLFSDDPSIAYDNKLNGSRAIPSRLKLQWSRFFNAPGANTAKRTRQIDSRLSLPLHHLPSTALPDSNPEALLPFRNLLRGQRMQLPSGQEMARRMGVAPLTVEQLKKRHIVKLNKDTFDPLQPESTTMPYANGYEIAIDDDTEIGPIISRLAFNGEVPLWFYILKEAELIGKTRTLGPVGGRIVTETLVGMLQRDKTSYLYLNPSLRPGPPIATRKNATTGEYEFGIYDLLRYAYNDTWT
jgi:hypothetical protein